MPNPYGQPTYGEANYPVSQPMYQPYMQPVQPYNQPVPPKSNMIFVTSAEDALNRAVEFNTEIVYFHQSENYGFQVKTDLQGKKAIQPFKMIPCTLEDMQSEIQSVKKNEMVNYVTQEQFDKRMTDIETKIDRLSALKPATASDILK